VPTTLNWFLPLQTDGAQVGTWPPEGAEPSLTHLTAVVQTAEAAGFSGLLVPVSLGNHLETWTAATAALATTRTAKTIIAVRPNLVHPVMAAKLTHSLSQLFPGRIALNIVTGAWPSEDAATGVQDTHDERYARLREWLAIFDGLWSRAGTREPFDFTGETYRVVGASLYPYAGARPEIYFSGASPEALTTATAHADVQLLWMDTEDIVEGQIEHIRRTFERAGREVRFSLRSHVLVRPTEEEAMRAADHLIARLDPAIAETRLAADPSGSTSKSRQDELTALGGWLSPHVWTGPGRGRFGAACAVVGDGQQVADTLRRYQALGVEDFILSGFPKLDEAELFGRLVTRRLLDADLQHLRA